jgi:beta-mannosidase
MDWDGSVHWSLETLDGKVIEKGEVSVKAAAAAVTPVCNLDFSKKLDAELTRKVVFVAELWQGGKIVSRQTAFFVPTKHLDLTDPAVSTHLFVEQGQIRIELTSRSLARLIECSLDGADVNFSDNYFDLPAGRPVNILAPLPSGWTAAQARAALKVRSIYDSFAHSAAK